MFLCLVNQYCYIRALHASEKDYYVKTCSTTCSISSSFFNFFIFYYQYHQVHFPISFLFSYTHLRIIRIRMNNIIVVAVVAFSPANILGVTQHAHCINLYIDKCIPWGLPPWGLHVSLFLITSTHRQPQAVFRIW